MKSRFFNTCFIFLFLFLGVYNQAISQVTTVTETRVRAELADRGISEEELLKALEERGIEIEDLESLTPSQLAEVEQIVEELQAKGQPLEPTQPDTLQKEDFLEETPEPEEAAAEQIKEMIIEEAEDQEIPPQIYGHSFFINKDLKVFEKSSEVKAPSSYILGAGDRIVVSIWGLSQGEFAFEINEEGYIEHENRRVFLKGIKLSEAILKLRSFFSRFYRFNTGEFDVSISFSRSISVSVQGEVKNPGAYTLPAVNNAFNALIAAEGPTPIGSLREILLVKKNGDLQNLDFYSYLNNPSNISNASLEEGDVIVVPVAKKMVSIVGAVNRSMIYELVEEETLEGLIELGGGFSENARKDLVQLERFEKNSKRIITIPSTDFSNFKLIDGDRVTVTVVDNIAENYVRITGAVYNPGVYENTQGLNIGQLLVQAGLKETSRKDVLFLKRKNADASFSYLKLDVSDGSPDLALETINLDELIVFDLARFTDNEEFIVSGSVRDPGRYNIGVSQSIPIKDAIELAGGLRRDASGYAIIHQQDPLNLKQKSYRRINLVEAFEDPENHVVTAMERIEVFSKELFDEESSVSITGAVNNPGIFQFGDGMELGDVLTMAGGFKLAASTNKIEISRLIIEENEPTKSVIANLSVERDLEQDSENLGFKLQPYDEIMVRYVPEFEMQKVVTIHGEIKYPGEYSLIKENENVRDLVERAGGLTSEAFPAGARLYRNMDEIGYVIIKLDEVLSKSNSRYNFQLRAGDILEIPKLLEFVTIIGATNAQDLYANDILGNQNSINVPFHKGKKAKFYIDEYAGGIAENGSLNEVYVENPNGEIVKTKNYGIFKSFPTVEQGGKVVVGVKPPKITEDGEEKEKVDWTEILSDSVAQAMSVLTLLLLIDRL